MRPGLFFTYVNEFGALPIDPTISTITRFCGGDMVTSLISDLSQNSDRRSSPRSFWVMGPLLGQCGQLQFILFHAVTKRMF